MIFFIFNLFFLVCSFDLECTDVPLTMCRYFPYCMRYRSECVQDWCYSLSTDRECYNGTYEPNGEYCKKNNDTGHICTYDGRRIDQCTMHQNGSADLCEYYGCDVVEFERLDVSVCIKKYSDENVSLCTNNSKNCKFIYFCKWNNNGACVEDLCVKKKNKTDCGKDSSCTWVNDISLCVSGTRTLDSCFRHSTPYGGQDRQDCVRKGCDGHRNMVLSEENTTFGFYGTTVCVGGNDNECRRLGKDLCKYNLSCYYNGTTCQVDGCFSNISETSDISERSDCREHCGMKTFNMEGTSYKFCSTIDRRVETCTYKKLINNGVCPAPGCESESKTSAGRTYSVCVAGLGGDCIVQGDCRSGFICEINRGDDRLNKICVAGLGGTCHEDFVCTTNPEYKKDLICDKAVLKCASGLGGACPNGVNDCKSGLICEENTCVAKLGDSCKINADCSGNLTCQGDTLKTCVAGLGGFCENTVHCENGLTCEGNNSVTCVSVLGGFCYTDADCLNILTCEGNNSEVCVSVLGGFCYTDADCLSFLTCKENETLNETQTCAAGLGGACFTDAHCLKDLFCEGDICVSGLGGVCFTDADCSGELICSGVCAEVVPSRAFKAIVPTILILIGLAVLL